MRFYDEVFGWKELPTETVDGKKLVLSAYTYEQFVFLIADDPPMVAPRLDHFGMSVETEQEIEDMLARDEAQLLERPDPFVVVLDELQDPQNLGAICRTVECVGADGVVIPERRSAEVTPAVCKASAGAVEHLSVARVRNVADFLAAAKDAGCWCYGAAAEGAEHYLQPDYSGGCALVIGAEGRGLRPRVAAACDQLVALPLRGHVQSLNASAAAAALLYGILQKRNGA